LDGAKTPRQEKSIGSEETHGEHTGVLEDSSTSKWDQKTLPSKPTALPLHQVSSQIIHNQRLLSLILSNEHIIM